MFTPARLNGFVRLALAALVIAVCAHTRADPDLWGNVRFGRDIVAARSVHMADPYAFTSDRPWTNHEWLAEVIIYAAYAAGGDFGLVALKLALLLAVAVAASTTMRSIPARTHDLLMAMLLVGMIPQSIHVRPQLFSLALFAWLLAALVRMSRGRERWAIAIPLITIMWASLHGGWLVGAGTLGVWAAVGVIAPIGERDRWRTIVVAAIAIAATVVNPYGIELWSFLRATVGFGRADIADWQPIYRIGLVYLLLWILVAVPAAVASWSALRTRTLDPRVLTVVVMFAIGSFRVNRLLAFFAIAVVLLLHEPIAAVWRAKDEAASPRPMQTMRAALAALIACIILVGSVSAAARNAGCVQIETSGYPEPGVARVVSAARLQGRMLTWFGWGHYAIWHFAPAISISMDGRRETVYSDAEIQRHLQFYFVPDKRQQVIDVLKPDYIWIPADLPVVGRLESDGWKPLFAGSESVLLARHGAAVASSQPDRGARRCFPGP